MLSILNCSLKFYFSTTYTVRTFVTYKLFYMRHLEKYLFIRIETFFAKYHNTNNNKKKKKKKNNNNNKTTFKLIDCDARSENMHCVIECEKHSYWPTGHTSP